MKNTKSTKSTKNVKRLSTALAALALPLTGVLASPATASAPPVLVTCTGTNTVAFSPGLTNTPRSVSVRGQDTASHCASVTNPELTSFVGPFSGTTTQSCTSLFAGGSGRETLKWNDGTSSSWSYTNSFSNVNGTKVGTSTGPITSGTLAGTTVTQTLTFPNLDLTGCTTPEGLPGLNGIGTWTFTHV